jgi:DNA replication protein DnaC
MAEARLPAGKTLATFDFDSVPMVSKAQVMALASGDAWLKNGANLLLFGPPGGGKSHLSAAIGLALVESGWRVLFQRTSDLVQRLQVARREPVCPGAEIARAYRVPAYLKEFPRTHAIISFSEEVTGPVVIGAGRHFGLGLFAAVP